MILCIDHSTFLEYQCEDQFKLLESLLIRLRQVRQGVLYLEKVEDRMIVIFRIDFRSRDELADLNIILCMQYFSIVNRVFELLFKC